MPEKHARTASSDDVLKHPTPKRAKEIDAHSPFHSLQEHIKSHSASPKPKTILHWFRNKDLRAEDNKSLHAASELAQKHDAPLLTCFVHSPHDEEWHGTSPARIDFVLETLRLLREQLGKLGIPLEILKSEERVDKVPTLLKWAKEKDVSHIFGNWEYEVDELRRDIKVFKLLDGEAGETNGKNGAKKGKANAEGGNGQISFQLFHDQTAIEPLTLLSSTGNPIKVFTPYHKTWLSNVASDPSYIDVVGAPKASSESLTAKEPLKSLLASPSAIPSAPESKQFPSTKERDRIRKLWPAGHAAGHKRLQEFLSKKVKKYASTRSNPAEDSSSRLSVYFSSGALSSREAFHAAAQANGKAGAKFEQGDAGISSWVRELVFREFYRQMLAASPHDSMNLPHNLKFEFVQWEDDEEGWKKWCDGTTGVPFVDAGMRQLKVEAWMHNRLRMNVSSYLSRSLLIDYRRGERWFAENLVDWDLANNTFGWEPSYTVFNPVSQAERNDPEGEYIRRWVPELKDVKGKAVFDPSARLSEEEFEKLGYPRPHVDWSESKQRCLARYKSDMSEVEI